MSLFAHRWYLLTLTHVFQSAGASQSPPRCQQWLTSPGMSRQSGGSTREMRAFARAEERDTLLET